ncbi:DUF742 domain-containing protein [Amycolatopsis sp. OK19-0408]|uniref:DUF742 domain-containing protein n=1 Tax=Amycolatopsis iheyensis TaxID=2945988 RepID=A0A9X2NI10_9PSEU|nr:DUF742 domain-containing protein [Amycolatopsis iheyensis]MCR6487085.1 DUF742 domain-containing protein [Amycolatopsis iheyensis]
MREDRRTTVTRAAEGQHPSTGRHALRTPRPSDITPSDIEDRLAGPDVEPVIPRQDHAPRTLVRPYVLTRGRTQSRRHLAIEALVSTRAGAHWNGARITGEFRSVRTLCHRPRSVAEVAATIGVPLGVVRVLLDDMAEQGLVTIHDSRVSTDGRPALALMERVLHGLRRL